MEYNEILTTKLEQCIDAFNTFNGENVAVNAQLMQDNIAAAKALQDALKAIKIPEEIVNKTQHVYEHKHLNAGVRFSLITLIAVILVTSGFSAYFYNKYTEVKGFENNFEFYKKNNDWGVAFFNYMNAKHPRDSKAFMNNHPLPK